MQLQRIFICPIPNRQCSLVCTITPYLGIHIQRGPTIAGDPVETKWPKQTKEYPNARLGGIIMGLAVGTLIIEIVMLGVSPPTAYSP